MSESSNILVSSPKAIIEEDYQELMEAAARVLKSGWYILGAEVDSFEQQFASWNASLGGVGVATGTDAVKLGLMALGVQHGDKVIMPSHTAVATAIAIRDLGAIPVFCDIDPDSRCIAPGHLKELVSEQTKAIVAVHIYGHPCDMDEVMNIAESYGIPVLEDCAQAHGALWSGKKVGNFGSLGAFSFYPTKNLGAIGDGGAILGNDAALLQKLKILRQYGWAERYITSEFGINSRLDELQAAFLKVALAKLEVRNNRRRDIAKRYTEALRNVSIQGPTEAKNAHHVYHLYVIESDDRNGLREYLHSLGVRTSIQYPAAVHQQAYFVESGFVTEPLENTERLYERIISIPMDPCLNEEEIERVCEALREA